MKTTILSLLSGLALLAAACGGGSSKTQDMAAAPPDFTVPNTPQDFSMVSTGDMTPTLTVNNTLAWCTVTVTVGNEAPVTFATTDAQTFSAPEGTTVNLTATPNTGFFPVEWTGVTTMNGSMATYLMTGAAMQSVTACCGEGSVGGGC